MIIIYKTKTLFVKKKKAAKKYNKEIFNGEEKMFNKKKMLKINI